MEGSVEHSSAGAGIAAAAAPARQLNDHPPAAAEAAVVSAASLPSQRPPQSEGPYRQRRRPSESHAAAAAVVDRSCHSGGGLSHRAYAVARDHTGSEGRCMTARKGRGGPRNGNANGNEGRRGTASVVVAPAGPGTWSHSRPSLPLALLPAPPPPAQPPPAQPLPQPLPLLQFHPGCHLKPRRSWVPVVSLPRAATTTALQSASSSQAIPAPLLLVPGLPLQQPSHSFVPRSSTSRVVFHQQQALKLNPYSYFIPLAISQPPSLPPPNYFHGYGTTATPSINYHHQDNNNNNHHHYHHHPHSYHLVSTVPAVMPISVSTTPAVKPSTAPSSPTPNVDKKSWQQKLSDHCEATNLPKPVFGLMSDRRGGRTAWQGTVRVGTYHVIKARYWYNGHYNAYEDAAELMLNIFEKRSNGEQQSPTSPQTSPQTARPYFGSDEFSNYTTTAGSSSEAAVRAGGGVGVGVGVGSIGGNGSYTYGSIGDAVVGQGLGGGLRHTHSHSLAHGSQARGAASFVSNYGG